MRTTKEKLEAMAEIEKRNSAKWTGTAPKAQSCANVCEQKPNGDTDNGKPPKQQSET